MLLLIYDAPGHPRALVEMDGKILVVFMPSDTASVLQPKDQGLILSFIIFRDTFCKIAKWIVILLIDLDKVN